MENLLIQLLLDTKFHGSDPFFQYGCVILFIGTVKLNLVQLDKLLKSIVFLFFIAGLIGFSILWNIRVR